MIYHSYGVPLPADCDGEDAHDLGQAEGAGEAEQVGGLKGRNGLLYFMSLEEMGLSEYIALHDI